MGEKMASSAHVPAQLKLLSSENDGSTYLGTDTYEELASPVLSTSLFRDIGSVATYSGLENGSPFSNDIAEIDEMDSVLSEGFWS